MFERLWPKHRSVAINHRNGKDMPLAALGRTHIPHEVFFMQPLHDEQDGRVRGVPARVQGLRVPLVALLPADGQRVQRLNGVVDDDAAAELRALPARAEAGQRAFRAHAVNSPAHRGAEVVLPPLPGLHADVWGDAPIPVRGAALLDRQRLGNGKGGGTGCVYPLGIREAHQAP